MGDFPAAPDQPQGELTPEVLAAQEDEGAEALPTSLNPESPFYQPWAEKQIHNAAKEKRPLEEFLAELDQRLAGYSDLPQERWDVRGNENFFAKFAPPQKAPRRRRRRSGAHPAPVAAVVPEQRSQRPPRPKGSPQRDRSRSPEGLRPSPQSPAPAQEAGSSSAQRRRRRRRPRGGRGGETSAPA